MFRFRIKLAFRNVLKNKVYSALIIGGFSIGFTACILIALFYNVEHNVDKQFPNYENIYRLYDVKNAKCGLNYNFLEPLSKDYPEILNVCPMEYSSNYRFTIKNPETNSYVWVQHIIITTNNFFDIFSVSVVASLSQFPFKDLNSAVISESTAKRFFGDENPLGKTIEEEFFTATVSAVVKDLPENSSFTAEIFLNSNNKNFQMSQECNNNVCIYPTSFFLLLKKGINSNLLSQKINSTLNEKTSTDSLALQKLSDIYLSKALVQDEHAKGSSKTLLVFLTVAFLIIVLSSINYLNYTVSLQYSKLKEIGISKTNGANKKQLVNNLLIEVTIGILISLIISVLLTSAFLPYTDVLFGRKVSLSDVNFYQLIPVFIAAILGIIILNSLAPIYVLSRFSITEFLSGNKKRNGKQVGRQVMLIFQLTVSIALIAIVMIIFKQLKYIKHYDLGYSAEQLVRLDLPYLYEKPSVVKNEMEKLPFVTNAALSDGYPGQIKLMMGDGTEENRFMLNCIFISDDYLKTMGMQLLQGRNFLPSDKDNACIMNEEAVKQYGWESIQDKVYHNGNDDGYHVIGVVKNFNVESLHKAISPVVLLYNPDHRFANLSLRLSPGNVGQQMDRIKQVWNKTVAYPMNFTFYSDQVQAMYNKEEKLAKSITFFSFIAVILTCMGLLGQFFLISLNRTKEIGIRKVNGANVFEILLLLNKNFLTWVLVSFVIAVPVAFYIMRLWLQNFAYKTTLSWWVFALAGIIPFAIEILTVSWLSWRAAVANPIESLRYE
ncbi:MAG TPA: ABC transporter permease [Tenuifilaceae bacterium]|nr:ABC transporter permease [Tenuifilaceae bacterium]